MARYPLSGGPCDGQQSINFTVKPPEGYLVLCQTHEYSFGRDEVFHDAGVASVFSGGGGLDTRQAGTAWHKLMHAFGVDGPRAINRSRAGRKRIRRAVR